MAVASLAAAPLVPLARLRLADAPGGHPLDHERLAGRLVELSGQGPTSRLSFAFSLVRDAQLRGEPAAWVTHTASAFFPPDVAACGVDLDALAVARLPVVEDVPRAADHLLRSGAFGLVALDLCAAGDAAHRALPLAAQSRLAGLARRHAAVVLCLTEKGPGAGSLGPLVSLHLDAARGPVDDAGLARCALRALKDKRREPGWTVEVTRRAPDGVR